MANSLSGAYVNAGEGRYYPTFDIIRLFLAIQVVAIHSGAFPSVLMNPVPAFLAIGGFVVYGSVERNSVSQFFINRALRLLPLLFVSFIAVWVAFDFKAMVANVVFWIFPFGENPANPVVWSLMYEEFYYCLLILFCVFGVYKYRWAPIVLSVMFGFFACKGFYFGLPAHFFILGCAFFLGNAAYVYKDKIKQINPWVSALFLIVCLVYTSRVPYPQNAERLFGDFVSFVAMLLFAISGPRFPRLKFDLSYSIYLIHCLVLAQLVYFIPLGSERLFWVMLLTTLPISYACWFIIEKPALSLRYRLAVKKPTLKMESSEKNQKNVELVVSEN